MLCNALLYVDGVNSDELTKVAAGCGINKRLVEISHGRVIAHLGTLNPSHEKDEKLRQLIIVRSMSREFSANRHGSIALTFCYTTVHRGHQVVRGYWASLKATSPTRFTSVI